MELKEVIGRRRTIRFFPPHRPVERDKVQRLFEVARRASCAGNVMNARRSASGGNTPTRRC
ncbi:MAG: nitroreductase family protein [Dehalococcoidia bacterium]|nr:nitroreductase family protein [Dehalococcoidia bacterium]